MVVRYGGRWDKCEYMDGDEQLIYIPLLQLSLDNLIGELRDIVQQSYPLNTEYLLIYLTKAGDGRKIKVSLKTDRDLARLIGDEEEPIVYVTEKLKPIVSVTEKPKPGSSTNMTHKDDENSGEQDEEMSQDDEEEIKESDRRKCLIAEFSAWIREPGRINEFMRIVDHGGHYLSSGSSRLPQGDNGIQASNVDNWLIPVAHFDDATAVVRDGPLTTAALAVGAAFLKKDDLEVAVGRWHMEHEGEYCVRRSCTKRLHIVCKHDGCRFQIRAISRANMWIIYKFEPIHTCQLYLPRNNPRTAPSKVIASFFSKKLLHEGVILKPKEMMAELKNKFAIEVHYSAALRARNLAIEMIYGAYDKSYQMLPGYLYMLKQCNPGTVYDLHTADDDRFMYMFLALGVSVSAWSACMRPVIVVDGTQLKGKNKGVLFVAVTKDGNEQCFPLAVGICHIENDESWIWFLTRLRSTFGQADDLLIVSDQHSSIKNAIETVYPNVAHGFCYYHIVKKLARFGAHVVAMFPLAAYTYRDEAFQKYWLILANASPEGAYKKLMKVGIGCWARSQCPVRRFSFMTSNAAESFNGRLLWARQLPICSLVEVIRNVIEKWFNERRSLAYARDHQLTEEAYAKVSFSMKKELHFEIRATTTPNVYKVEDKEDQTYVVDLDKKTCECREFQLDLIPCPHAAAAIRYDFIHFRFVIYMSLL